MSDTVLSVTVNTEDPRLSDPVMIRPLNRLQPKFVLATTDPIWRTYRERSAGFFGQRGSSQWGCVACGGKAFAEQAAERE